MIVYGIYCLTASRIYVMLLWEECLAGWGIGDVCLAASGSYALLPLWIWSFAAQRKENNRAPQKRIMKCGSIQEVGDCSAWLPDEFGF